MNRKILYLDLDGVVADFDTKIEELCPGLHLLNYDDRSETVDKYCAANPEFFHDLPPISGAIEAVNRLFPIYEVYFLSTPMWDVPGSFSGKRIWIETHFGELAKKRLILTHRKDLCFGDFLVDDRTKNGAGEFRGVHIHFGTEAFPDWETTFEYLLLNR